MIHITQLTIAAAMLPDPAQWPTDRLEVKVPLLSNVAPPDYANAVSVVFNKQEAQHRSGPHSRWRWVLDSNCTVWI